MSASTRMVLLALYPQHLAHNLQVMETGGSKASWQILWYGCFQSWLHFPSWLLRKQENSLKVVFFFFGNMHSLTNSLVLVTQSLIQQIWIEHHYIPDPILSAGKQQWATESETPFLVGETDQSQMTMGRVGKRLYFGNGWSDKASRRSDI